MATIPDSVKAQLDADWTGAGGVEPTYYVEEDYRTNPPLGQDAVWILSSTLDTDPKPVNDKFTDEAHVLEMVVNTLTSEDRLKELGDEVVRILNATAITDITYQRLKRRKITSGVDKGVFNYQEVITYDLREQMKSSAAAYGAGSGPALTQAQLEDAIMFGSANRAYVPCIYETGTVSDKVINSGQNLGNLDGSDNWWLFELPLPPLKGGLKLYVDGIQIGLFAADADDYISGIFVVGQVYDAASDIFYNDNVDKTSRELIQANITPKDCSIFETVRVTLNNFCTDAADLVISSVSLRCYYAA